MQSRAHQNEALRRLGTRPLFPSDEDVFAWLMEMGTGKSKVIIDEFGQRELAGDLQDLLIVAPAGAYRNWWRQSDADPGELQKHASEDLWDRMLVGAWVSGAGTRHIDRLRQLLAVRDRPRVLVVNIEALSTVEKARVLCREFLRAPGRRSMLAVDESTMIKSPDSNRTRQLIGGRKKIVALRELADTRRIATGLVAPRDPLDLWSQFAFLDWRILGQRSYYGFRSRYAVLRKMEHGGRRFDVVVGFRNVNELHERIAPYSYRCLKDQCLDLEPKVYIRRDVDLTDEQARLYREMKEHACAALSTETFVTATQVITQILRLDQLLCGHIVDENGVLHHVPDKRIAALLEVLGEHDGKAIIWTAYDPCVRKIVARLQKEYGPQSVAAFWGANKTTRHEDELRFKTDPACRFMVATPAAGGRGNTWTVAGLSVYHSNTYDLEQRAQSEDRNHRDGLVGSAVYVDLVAPGTVDEKKLRALRGKIDMASTISGDAYREWLI